MHRILASRNRHTLGDFLAEDPLLAFDFDGTLAPIVENRDAAFMRGTTHGLLRELASRRCCAVITGRSRADALGRVQGIPLLETVGNHGIEPFHDTAATSRMVRTWHAALEVALHDVPGVDVEDKKYSISVHYRAAAHPARARTRIVEAADALGSAARIIGGKAVVNIVPAGAPTKLAALHELMRRASRRSALYVGDDDTDEDVFRGAIAESIMTVRVGRDARSLARWYIDSQDAMDDLLRCLLDLSPARGAAAESCRPADEIRRG